MEKPSANLKELLQHGYRYAMSITHNKSRAEDLLQDAWVAIMRADGPHNKNYLFSSIRSHYINQNKRDRLVPMVPLEDEVEDLRDDLFSDINNEMLEHALATLRPVERETLFLSAVEGYTAQEIADFTKQPRGTILSLIHRAQKKIRQYFEGELKEVQP